MGWPLAMRVVRRTRAVAFAVSQDGCAAQAEVQWLGLGLAALLFFGKVLLLPFPVTTFGEFLRYLLRLAIVCAPDVVFAVLLTAAALTTCRLWTHMRFGRLLRAAWFLVFYAAGLYGAASVPIYHWTKAPLTLPVLMFVGGAAEMASSIKACVDGWSLAAVVLFPLAACGAAAWLKRLQGVPHLRWPAVLAVVVAALTYGAVCRAYVNAAWKDPNRWERRIAQNPHTVFLASCAKEFIAPGAALAFAAEAGDEWDFHAPRARDVRDVWAGVPQQRRPKNVVLIVLESTGVEYLGLYGAPHNTTPHLQRLAANQGVVFENFYIQTPSSCNSLVSLTAGVLPRMDWTLIVRDCPEFSAPTLPRLLKEHGYRTCFAHAGYWKWKDRDTYLRRSGVDCLIDADSVHTAPVNSWGIADRDMFQAALDWVDSSREPFFLLAYTIETHHPYVARPPLVDFGVDDGDFNRYLNSLRAADATIAWFVKEIERRGLADSTLIAVTSDHGESFGQHNQRIHSFSVYESAVHVPLVLLHPALAARDELAHAVPGNPAGAAGRSLRRVAGVRQQVDLTFTLVALLGIEPPAAWQGDHLFRQREKDHAYFFALGNQAILGVREGPWKYHYYVDSGLEELFHVASDAAELRNLAAGERRRCDDYRRRVAGMVNYQRRYLAELGAR